MKLIGIDYATKARNTGLALGFLNGSQISVNMVTVASETVPPLEILNEWISDFQPAILAIDAPLGWPEQMGEELTRHSAGQPLEPNAKQFFCRLTDRIVEKELGKRPLEVGANLIARTALSALKLLDDLRRASGQPIPLAWGDAEIDRVSAIEVYPAGTLVSYKEILLDYDRKNLADRLKMLQNLGITVENKMEKDLIKRDLNAFDAVVCLRAAADFLQGNCIAVPDKQRASKEGWIWVKKGGNGYGKREETH